MDIHELLHQPPTRFKTILCGWHGIPATVIARYLGYSYPHTVNLLNGVSRISSGVEAKLDDLVQQLEQEGGDSDDTVHARL